MLKSINTSRTDLWREDQLRNNDCGKREAEAAPRISKRARKRWWGHWARLEDFGETMALNGPRRI